MELLVEIDNNENILDSEGNIVLCPIYSNPVHIDKNIFIDKQLYDVENLYNYIKYKFIKDKEIARIPHNRKPFTEEILENINNRSNIVDCSKKTEIIAEIIKLLKFPKQTQDCLLALKDEERKIILEDYKINIILKLLEKDTDSIIDLVSEFYYLFNTNISDKVIINTIKSYNISLLLIPSNKITDNIIKFIIKYHNKALQFIPPELITDKVIELAVKIDGCVLQYIPVIKITDKIIKLAVKNNGRALQYIPVELITECEAHS